MGDVGTRRTERRLFRLNDELQRLRREAELAEGELQMHRHLADDAERDAVVWPGERTEARQAAKDVTRLQAALADTHRKLAVVEDKRQKFLARLGEPRRTTGA